ncbi:MAG: hypothetical protein WD623_02510 [Marinobacter sp.]|uniref:hypothetical protein n=1 Tax=Marinobacter sp. TaxID=50741 RepID=UPI00349FD8C4
MNEYQRFKIQKIALRLGISPETIEHDIEEAINASTYAEHVDDALAAAELLVAEASNIDPHRIWNWFLSPIPALAGKSLLSATLRDGVETAEDYLQRLREGDIS